MPIVCVLRCVAVYGTSPHQYAPQALTVAQPQSQYPSQPPTVVAAPAAVPQFHPPTVAQQLPVAPPSQKRERKPLVVVNPETNQAVDLGIGAANAVMEREVAAVAVTHHRTPERTTPQPVSKCICIWSADRGVLVYLLCQ